MQILKEVKIFLTTKFWTKVLIITVFELKILLYSQVLAHLGFSTKRAAPTVTQSETGAIGCYGSGFFRTSTDSTPFDSITHNSLRINITSFNSNGTQGNGTYVQLVTNNVSNISIDAEL